MDKVDLRTARISHLLHMNEGKNIQDISAIKLLGSIYKNGFDVSSLNAFWNKVNKAGTKDTYFNAVKQKLNEDPSKLQLAKQVTQQAANRAQTQQQQTATGNGEAPANPQKSEEIAKKADEIPQKAEQPVNNEYWHKVWTSLSNKAGSLNGQEELQKVVNNFVTELGRIVNK